MRQGESNMLIPVLKGVAFVFALFAMALAAFLFLGRGGQFDTRFFTTGGAFLSASG
jgi:hypothetical protein